MEPSGDQFTRSTESVWSWHVATRLYAGACGPPEQRHTLTHSSSLADARRSGSAGENPRSKMRALWPAATAGEGIEPRSAPHSPGPLT